VKPGKRISRIVIIGAGVTGLSTAYYLQKLYSGSSHKPEIIILEKNLRSGGKISTFKENDLVVESGPDSIFRSKPWGMQLVRDLGIEGELIEPQQDHFYLHREDDSLVKISGQTLFAAFPANLATIWNMPFLSLTGKIRASLYSGSLAPKEDLPLGPYLKSLWGQEFAEKVAIPLFSSIHSGDPDKLSAAMVFPALWKKRKPEGGKKRAASGKSYFGLKSGMSFLTETLQKSLAAASLQLLSGVDRIEQSEAGFLVVKDDGSAIAADAVVVTVPSFAAAKMLSPSLGAISSILQKIEHASGVVVTLGYQASRISHPLDATGFISTVPKPTLTGCTFSTRKWTGRAPAGQELLRVFIRAKSEECEKTSDEDLVKLARDIIEPILKIDSSPLSQYVSRWSNSFPQYNLGHRDLLQAISSEELRLRNRLLFAGCSYRGVGIPDCIGQAIDAAKKLYEADHISEF